MESKHRFRPDPELKLMDQVRAGGVAPSSLLGFSMVWKNVFHGVENF